jgi:hypothetical protein
MAAQSPAPSLRRVDAGFISTERRLAAQLNARHFRSLRLASLQALALASLPLWAQALGLVVWGWVAWLAFLVAGTCLALAISYAVLEQRWSRRAQLKAHSSRALVHIAPTRWDQARAGLWCGLAAASVPPWAASGLGRALPTWLVGPLTVPAAVLMASLLVIEMTRRASRLEAGSQGRIVAIDDTAQRRLDDAS